MNSVFRLVWNTSTSCWQAVAETARGRHKKKTKTGVCSSKLILISIQRFNLKPLALCLAIGLFGATVYAEPTGGQVTTGAGTINQTGAVTTINQATQNMAIDWHSFNIRANEAVNFNQPNANAIALNRVTGTESSSIMGSMTANGKVFILNPNGILIGAGAQVNVGGLVASTLNLSNENFMAGNFNFTGNGIGNVVNHGNINIANGGTLAFIAPVVKNNGTIVTNNGHVLLAAADDVTLTLQDGNMVSYTLNKGSLQSMIDSGGLIQANGGHVIITTKGLDALSKSAINHTGIIEAQTVNNNNGVIELLGDMEIGTLNVAGTLDASAPTIGDGGFIETSAAKVNIANDVHVTTKAENGETGTWLIDPVDFTVAASGGDMTGQTVSNALLNNNFTIDSDNGSNGTGGNVFINDEITWSANLLRIDADDSIYIREKLNGSGSATLAFNYGLGTSNGEGSNYYIHGGKVNLPQGNRFFTKQGLTGASVTHHVITSLGSQFQSGFFTLQGVKDNLFRNYVLGSDIDASATSTWNAGFGFDPIGDLARAFTGTFDGFGHTISGLTINRPNENAIGLFGSCTGCEIQNVGLVNANITGGDRVGGLLGNSNSGSFSGNYVTGSIRGNNSIGGLVGSASYGNISNNYSTASVNGNIWVGGLIGGTGPSLSITNNFSAGAVTGIGVVGGLVGQLSSASTASNNFWDTQVSGQVTSATGAGKTTAELQQQATFNGWDFNNVWGIAEGKSLPFLRSFNLVYIDNINYIPVYNLNQLQKINEQLNANYALLNGIDASATVNWNAGEGFIPLGNSDNKFSGRFDGLGHVIDGLTIQNQNINQSLVNFIGLFGYANEAIVSNIGLENVNIFDSYAFSTVGALVGRLDGGTINNSYATGNVTGTGSFNSRANSTVGGLVGLASATTISKSYSSAGVIGAIAGGLIGNTNSTTIENSYATGNVSGNAIAGGLIGLNDFGSIINSYSNGNVSGANLAGGLVALTNGSTLNNSFWNVQTSGQNSSSGGVGKTTAEMQQQATYTGWDFDNVWRIQEGSSYPLLRALTEGTIIIDPTKPNLEITAPNVSKIYDGIAVSSVADLSTLTGWNGGVSTSGLLGADTLSDLSIFSGTLRYDGTWQGALNAGDYTIIPAGLSAQKYAINYIDGSLKINPKEIEVGTLAIGADNKTKIYGELDPLFTYTINQGQLISNDAITGDLVREAGEDVRPQGYKIQQGTLTAGTNYTINFTDGLLTIEPRPLVLQAQDTNRYVGDSNPDSTSVLSVGAYGLADGTVNGIGFNDRIDEFTFTSSAPSDAAADTKHSISISSVRFAQGTKASNYDVTLESGQLTIVPDTHKFYDYWDIFGLTNAEYNRFLDYDKLITDQVKKEFEIASSAYDDKPTRGFLQKFPQLQNLPQYNGKLESGFDAKVYRDNSNGTIYIAFRGSEDVNDWKTNFEQMRLISGISDIPSQYTQAITLTDEVIKDNLGANIKLVGHSLGGGLSMYVGGIKGLDATTFNAAKLNPVLTRNIKENIKIVGTTPFSKIDNYVFNNESVQYFNDDYVGSLHLINVATEGGFSPLEIGSITDHLRPHINKVFDLIESNAESRLVPKSIPDRFVDLLNRSVDVGVNSAISAVWFGSKLNEYAAKPAGDALGGGLGKGFILGQIINDNVAEPAGELLADGVVKTGSAVTNLGRDILNLPSSVAKIVGAGIKLAED